MTFRQRAQGLGGTVGKIPQRDCYSVNESGKFWHLTHRLVAAMIGASIGDGRSHLDGFFDGSDETRNCVKIFRLHGRWGCVGFEPKF